MPAAPASRWRSLPISPIARRFGRYSAVTVIGLAISQLVLILTLGILGWAALVSNLVACAAATAPTFELNRQWVWGRSGQAHLRKELLPFWVLSFAGLAVSTAAAVGAETWARRNGFHGVVRFLVIDGSALSSLALLWIGKFVVFEHVLFAGPHGAQDVATTEDG